jgi:hypothetical protein
MDEALLDAFERKIFEELYSMKHPWYIHVQNVYARRRS